MKKFCKLFENEELGQVLVKIDVGEDGPEVKTSISLDDLGLGICSVSLAAKVDTEESWESYEKIFSDMTEEFALSQARILRNNVAKMIAEK